jgi:hypothetical protein
MESAHPPVHHKLRRSGSQMGSQTALPSQFADRTLQTGPTRAQACPSNRLVTDPSSKTSRIARLIKGAIDNSVSLSNRQ